MCGERACLGGSFGQTLKMAGRVDDRHGSRLVVSRALRTSNADLESDTEDEESEVGERPLVEDGVEAATLEERARQCHSQGEAFEEANVEVEEAEAGAAEEGAPEGRPIGSQDKSMTRTHKTRGPEGRCRAKGWIKHAEIVVDGPVGQEHVAGGTVGCVVASMSVAAMSWEARRAIRVAPSLDERGGKLRERRTCPRNMLGKD